MVTATHPTVVRILDRLEAEADSTLRLVDGTPLTLGTALVGNAAGLREAVEIIRDELAKDEKLRAELSAAVAALGVGHY